MYQPECPVEGRKLPCIFTVLNLALTGRRPETRLNTAVHLCLSLVGERTTTTQHIYGKISQLRAACNQVRIMTFFLCVISPDRLSLVCIV